MRLYLSSLEQTKINSAIQITGSKSETNRMLLLKALYPNLQIENLSNADDRMVMESGVQKSTGEVDIHHAGTAMRFLTAYFASQEGKEVVLTGSARMKQRPIKVLVDALNSMGAKITYEANEGYPPIKIIGQSLTKNKVSLPANISSQYISALLMIAPKLKEGLTLDLIGEITSVPYINMTLGLLSEIGVQSKFEGNTIQVTPKKEVKLKKLVVESDWSAASYFYSIVALSEVGSAIQLSSYKQNSLQGDSVLANIYKSFGVTTTFEGNTVLLAKKAECEITSVDLDLSDAPDIAQTIAVTCFGLQIGCHLTGLHTLPIKETDRLAAMKKELEKIGAVVTITDQSLTLAKGNGIQADQAIDTYNDHRMAMAFAPIALKTSIFVNDAGVVSKSYPDFWNDLKTIGFPIKEVE